MAGPQSNPRRATQPQRSMQYPVAPAPPPPAPASSQSPPPAVTLPPPPPPTTTSPQGEARYMCPICLGGLRETMFTPCGHIFCKICITNALAYKAKCPTCKRRVKPKNIRRLYL